MSAGPSAGSDLRRLWQYSRPDGLRLALAVLLGACALGCSVGLLATAAWLISRASQQPPVLELTVAVVSVRAFGIGRGVFRYTERLVGHDAAFRGLTKLRVAMMERCAVIAPAGMGEYRSGDLLARLVGDVNAAVDLTVRVVVPWAAACVVGIAATILAAALLPMAGVVMALMLLVGGVLIPWLTARVGEQAQLRLAPIAGEYTSGVVTTMGGLADLEVSGATERALADLAEIDGRATQQAQKSAMSLGLGSGLSVATQGLAVIASLALGVSAVREGALDGVNLAVVTLLPLAAYEAVVGLPAAALALLSVRSSAQRVLAIIDADNPVPDPESRSDQHPHGPGVVHAERLNVTYPGAEVPAVSGISIDLAPGRKVALVGPSGAGKSTVAEALMRFLPYSGSVTLDASELTDLTGDAVRSRIGLMRQDGHVFDTSLAVNLRIARPDATDDDLRAALAAAHLGTWAGSLPNGLDTALGAHGSRMSGGERRRLIAAQLMLADRDVLVLDEPTEHLDRATADVLLADLLGAFKDRAVLLITHRFEALEDFHEIVVLEAGSVVERGLHSDLLAAGGAYAMMWRAEHRQQEDV